MGHVDGRSPGEVVFGDRMAETAYRPRQNANNPADYEEKNITPIIGEDDTNLRTVVAAAEGGPVPHRTVSAPPAPSIPTTVASPSTISE